MHNGAFVVFFILAISGELDTRVRLSYTYLFPAMVFGGIQIVGIFYSTPEVKDKKPWSKVSLSSLDNNGVLVDQKFFSVLFLFPTIVIT